MMKLVASSRPATMSYDREYEIIQKWEGIQNLDELYSVYKQIIKAV